MNSIQIDIQNYGNNIYTYIDVKNNTITINNIKKVITNTQITDLIRIIRNWENEYYDDETIDGEYFNITIKSDDGDYIIKGRGNYPVNYKVFKDWIREIYESRLL